MRGLAVGLAFILLATAAGAAEPAAVRTRAGLHGTFARLVFNWREEVTYEAEIRDGRLVVTFDKPFSSSFTAAEKQLVNYIGPGVFSDDQLGVSFPLRRPVSMKTFLTDRAVVVDLYNSSAAASSSSKSESPALQVKVRTGDHPAFTRFVFDWPQPVGYDLIGTGGDTRLQFDRPARLDTDRLARKFAKFLDASGTESSDAVSTVRFEVPADREVRHFRLDDRVVVDIMKPGRQATPLDPEESKPRGKTGTEPESRDAGESVIAEHPTPATAGAHDEPSSPPTSEKPVEAPATSHPVPAAVTHAISHRPTGAEHADNRHSSDLAPAPAAPAAEKTPVAEPAAGRKGPGIEVGFERAGDRFTLTFPGLGDARASVFRRADAIWIVFDRTVDLRLGTMERQAPDLARGVMVLAHPSATVFRVEEPGEYRPNAKRVGTAWVVDFAMPGRPPYRPLTVAAEPESSPGGRLVIAVDDAGETIQLIDPEVGDRLMTVPLGTPDTGLAESHEYPEIDLLASAQGIAAVQRGDELHVGRDGTAVEITAKAGLLLSEPPASRTSSMTAAAAPPPGEARPPNQSMPRLLDLVHWQRPGESFSEARQELEKAVADSDGTSVDARRLELAQFYLARGLAAEAIGVLQNVDPARTFVAEGPQFRALRGAANLLAHRLDAAEADLFHADLDGTPEASVWRAGLHAIRGEWADANRLFRDGWPLITGYPKWLRQEFGLRAAEAALNQGDEESGARYLASAVEPSGNTAMNSRARFLKGRVLAEQGHAGDALAVWNSVANGTDQLAHAKSELAAVKLGLQERLIDHPEAIDRLERLRFAWRGDALEFETLQLLGKSYLAAGDYRNGLGTLRDAVSLFSDTLDTAPATEVMTDSFRKLFVEGGIRDVPPLKAVSIYEEFRELTPIGDEGDRIARDLAARLVSLDLLEPAATLLDNQVRYRLKGEPQARSATDLALIHLLDRKPAQAADVLRMNDNSGLPGELATRRRHLMARALLDLGQADQAIAAIAADDTPDADSLRADIFWKEARWADAAAAYGRMAEAVDAGTLSASDSRVILKRGVALALAGDTAGLRKLAGKYAAGMTNTPFAAAFRMVTAAQTTPGNLMTITETLAKTEDFQSSLKGYRNALEKSATAGSPAASAS